MNSSWADGQKVYPRSFRECSYAMIGIGQSVQASLLKTWEQSSEQICECSRQRNKSLSKVIAAV